MAKTKTKTKTYLVPTVVHGSFGCELEVEATSAVEAQEKVRLGFGEMRDGDSYDWDRWVERDYKTGMFGRVTIVKEGQ